MTACSNNSENPSQSETGSQVEQPSEEKYINLLYETNLQKIKQQKPDCIIEEHTDGISLVYFPHKIGDFGGMLQYTFEGDNLYESGFYSKTFFYKESVDIANYETLPEADNIEDLESSIERFYNAVANELGMKNMTVLKNTDETDGYEKVGDCTTYEQFVEITKPMLIGPNSGYSTIQLSGFTKDGYFVVAGLANSLETLDFSIVVQQQTEN